MTARRVALVISDVDGTLVTSDKVLTARTRAAVASLARHGIAFTIVSSRPPFGMRMLVEPLDLRLPIAAFNGAVLAMPDLTILERRRIGREAARQALACFRSCDVDVWLFTEDRWLLRNPDGAYVEREVRTVQTQPVVVESFDRHLEQAVKLTGVSADFDRLAQCEARAKAALDAQATVARSQSYYLDITPPRVDKGVAVAELMRHCGVDPAEVVTIGDMDNDVPMFRRSGFSIAMGNGSAAAKETAQAATGSNDEDGFADAVERLILPRVAPA
jgi:Cof subfamily protein (haloacid dehalogenase superfamily)